MSSDAGSQMPSEQQPATGEVEAQLFGEPVPEDDSLLTFEEDMEFDPLKNRSNSLSLVKSGSIGSKAQMKLEQGIEPSISSPANESKPPLSSRESLGHIQDLTGIDLTSSSPAGRHLPQTRQDSLTELLHPLQMSAASTGVIVPAAMNMMVVSSAGMVPHPQGGVQIVSSGGLVQGQVPLAIQGGMAYGGGVPAVVPVVYAAQGTPGMLYQVCKIFCTWSCINTCNGKL